jgi:glycosyltransferase involved in cell wall biosynthesis
MRILHLIDSGGVYGAERILLYLAREQKRLGHDACIGSIARPEVAATPLEQATRAWHLPTLPLRTPKVPTPSALKALLRQLREYRPDVLHSHGYKADVLVGLVPRRLRAPMITTLHGYTSSRSFGALWVYEQLDRLALRHLEQVVVVTRSMLSLPGIRGLKSTSKRVIANGIPSLSARLADLGAGGIPALPDELTSLVRSRPTLVAIGRLSPEKGFALLVEAFARARAQVGTAHQLMIVGEGPERTALETKVISLGVHDHVHLVGYIEGADRLLDGAAGFVMSSYTEGMPLVLLEALQWGVPILATSVGAIPDLLPQERGMLVPPRSFEALKHGLVGLMSAPGVEHRPRHDSLVAGDESMRMAQEYLQAYRSIC